VLPELSPVACRAVSGRGDAAAILDELYKRNLFLVRLEAWDAGPDVESKGAAANLTAQASRAVYRYHDLFRDFLRERLARELPEWVQKLHRRAAEAEQLPARRIHHYLAAELWDEAAGAIELAGEVLLAQGGTRTVRGWIEALPEATRARRPRLLYLLGVCERAMLEWSRAREHFEQAEAAFAAENDRAGQGDSLAQLATLLLFMAYRDESISTARRALDCPIAPYHRAQLHITSAWVDLGYCRFDQVLADMDAALAILETTDDPRVIGAFALLFHSPTVGAPGAIRRVEQIERLIEAKLGAGGGPLRAIAIGLAAQVAFWRGRWDVAATHAHRLLAIGEQSGGFFWGDAPVRVVLALGAAFHGDDAGAQEAFAGLFAELAQPGAPNATQTWNMFYRLTDARASWLAGHPDKARALLAAIADQQPGPGRWSPLPVARPLLAGMVALADGRLAEAQRALEEADAIQRRDATMLLHGSAALLLAHLHRLSGRPAAALAALAPLLADWERDDVPGLLLWNGPALVAPLLRLAAERGVHAGFAARTLDLIAEQRFAVEELRFAGTQKPAEAQGSPATALAEPLTPRELEILRRLAAGANNQALAQELVISLHTVKRHVTHILQKLEVSSRLEAVARARELGLL
jgi:LuxR family maltose regulon positive regulatory protein